MCQFAPKRARFSRRIIQFTLIAATAVATGCAMTSLPTYNTRLIQQQLGNRQPAVWVVPELSALASTPPSAGLNGTSKPQPLPRFVPNVEPPLVVAMTVLSDGLLAFISPVEFAYESKSYAIATYNREVIKRVKIVLLDPTTGKKKWSREISAEGVYKITEINSTLLFSSNRYDINGDFMETRLAALNKQSGAVLWQRRYTQPFRYFSISTVHSTVVYSTAISGDADSKNMVEAIDVSTGKPRWSILVNSSVDNDGRKNTWPILMGDQILLFEDSVSLHKLINGNILWNRKGIEPSGFAQPHALDDTVWFQSNDGLVALAISSGKTRWTSPEVTKNVIKLNFSGNHLYVVETESTSPSKTHRLLMIDPATGHVLWQLVADPIIGNIVEKGNRTCFSTADNLITVDPGTGAVLFQSKLPWDDEFSSHTISLDDNAITIKNEWNVARWHRKDGTIVFQHHFEPLCPIMTTKERMRELRALGAQVSALTTGSVSFTNFIDTAKFDAQFSQAMSNYRSTGNSAYLYEAQANYGMQRSAIAQQRALAGLQAGLAMSMAVYQIGVKVIHKKITTTHSMVYPQIDAVIKNLRVYDNGRYVVRLVGVQIGNQRFSAIEVLDETTGKSKQYLLSPYQMPSELITVGSAPMRAHELNGYLPASIYLGHGFSTAVDLKRKCIYHYGPGLNPQAYIYFDDTGFARGRLWKYAADFSMISP